MVATIGKEEGDLPVTTDWRSPTADTLEQWRRSYRDAVPFPHLVIDDFFERSLLSSVNSDASSAPRADWTSHHTALQNKRMLDDPVSLPEEIARYFRVVYSQEFITLMERVTGIGSLLPDFSLYGGGLHEAGVHGHFEVHVDFQRHPTTGMRNRLALITYLNEGWTEEDGGKLELWNLKERKCYVRVAPIMGRTLLMGQSPDAAHGYPAPLPEGRTRRALIAYFYTESDDPVEIGSQNTHYLERPGLPPSRRALIALRRMLPTPVVKVLRVGLTGVLRLRERR
ncbi:hypothetical protein AA23498_2555 [Acetobacter nitrogenifigens DSM 23921 = NBRC 105050]|uniref:Prolyl 4-hydroxylase alpha subunit Fe(2+) 2OG dioxygenase domain-containing protein n=1 Tax=Acetobacter nitrogenifigens DSM 23921 = NBRC 105050 TaxID=1120919 RepID=A0A511X663_9PROT|nr:hypothetical protein AA23498_2555 [Acetobacter nitrogenifigens DSM 23921 = NBRC 105050]GEN58429.1 hypothetical protein ANI02nite_03130 [Acetobacter nitrogenifigens DSM 23921 = NBRC 105050]